MKEFKRELRVADHLRRELAHLIRSEMRDPRVGILAVNDVTVSKDLAYADVYVSSFGVDQLPHKQELIEVLNRAGGFLRSAVARQSSMRTTPKLRFHYDDTLARGAHLENLIQSALDADSSQHRPLSHIDLDAEPDAVVRADEEKPAPVPSGNNRVGSDF